MDKRASDEMDTGDGDASALMAKKLKAQSDEPRPDVATRRSSRLVSRSSTKTEFALLDSEPEEPTVAKDERKRVSKSQKSQSNTTIRRKNSKFGRLETFICMPFDILCEIAKYLGPNDLLNMSRSFKMLRTLLTCKDSRPIWRAACEAVELPECPSDLSEMQYASLLFDKSCYLCNAPKAQKVFFSLRLRLCNTCVEKNLMGSCALVQRLPVCPTALEGLQELLPLIPGNDYNTCGIVYSFEESKVIWKKLQELPIGSQEREDYIRDREAAVTITMEHGKRVDAWMHEKEESEAYEKILIVEERIDAVEEKLMMKGYTETDFDTTFDDQACRTQWYKLLNEPKRLTERIWKSMEPKLIDLIEKRQAAREAVESNVDDEDCDCDMCREDDRTRMGFPLEAIMEFFNSGIPF